MTAVRNVAADPAEPPIVAAGDDVVPGYEVIAHLRRGHRLDVYDAWSSRIEARCIVKVVRPDRITEAHTARLLQREGRILHELAHPHLVRAYEIVEEPQVAVAMETLTGPNLGAVLDERRRLGPMDVALLGAQIASALRFLHQHDCVHGDVTPGNIILEAGTAKLIDLSLSGPPGPVRAGSGTRGYRAPEQARGDRQTPATDVWGLGAVLFCALTGHTHDDMPPRLREPVQALRRRLGRRARLLRIIGSCLREAPEKRASLAEVSVAFAAMVPLKEA